MAKDNKKPKNNNQTKPDFKRKGELEDVRLTKAFDTYVRWKAIPPMLLNFTKGKKILSDEETCIAFGFDDPDTKELIAIKTQKQFAELFDLNENTLTEWNKKMDTRDMLADSRKWAKKLTKNVVLMLYKGAIGSSGMSFKYQEMFFKVINHWNEKQSIELDVGPSLFEILKKGVHDRRSRK